MKTIIAISLFAIGLLAGPVRAQESPSLSSLDILLWPEFDRPEVLVIHQGRLAEGTSLPASLELRIPARTGEPTAVAYVGEDGQRFNQVYTTRVDGDWLVVSFDLAVTGFQLEYYDGLSVGPDGDREFTFAYVADYPVEALGLDFQVPPSATGFALEPEADTVVQEDDGLTYHQVEAGPVEAGEAQSWTFSYLKSGSELTADTLAPAAPGGQTTAFAPAPSSGATGSSTVWIFLVAFVALVAVGAGAYWVGTRTQPPPPPPPRRSKRRGSGLGSQPGALGSTPEGAGADVRFCHICGAGLRADSGFCQKCGARVRTE